MNFGDFFTKIEKKVRLLTFAASLSRGKL